MSNQEFAFPHGPLGDSFHAEDGHVHHHLDGNTGMTLRDYFAGQALAGVLSELGGPPAIADNAYSIADAMMERRNSGDGNDHGS